MTGPRFQDRFVLGFAFTITGRVALIRKTRPSWQAGKLNGVGGHREPKEDSCDAMEREFFEETGVRIPAQMWTLRGHMMSRKKWHCAVYTVATDLALDVMTKTDEEVYLIHPDDIEHFEIKTTIPAMVNIEALLALCKMSPGHDGIIPLFTLHYE